MYLLPQAGLVPAFARVRSGVPHSLSSISSRALCFSICLPVSLSGDASWRSRLSVSASPGCAPLSPCPRAAAHVRGRARAQSGALVGFYRPTEDLEFMALGQSGVPARERARMSELYTAEATKNVRATACQPLASSVGAVFAFPGHRFVSAGSACAWLRCLHCARSRRPTAEH